MQIKQRIDIKIKSRAYKWLDGAYSMASIRKKGIGKVSKAYKEWIIINAKV